MPLPLLRDFKSPVVGSPGEQELAEGTKKENSVNLAPFLQYGSEEGMAQ